MPNTRVCGVEAMSERTASHSTDDLEIERPAGRDEVIAAALKAAADLFAKNNPSQVSVREIAHRAGVSHALIHRYLGTKEEIFRAVVDAERETAIEIWRTSDSVIDAPILFEGEGRPARYMTILLRAHLEGIDVSEDARAAMGPLLELLKTRPVPGSGEGPHVDQRVALLTVMAAIASMTIAHEFFLGAVGLTDLSREEVHEQYQRLLVHILSLGNS